MLRCLTFYIVILCSLQPVTALETEAWRSDLAALVERIETRHPSPFGQMSQTEFLAAVEQLGERLDELADAQVVVELLRLVASLGDAHTRLKLPVNPDHLSVVLGHTPDPPPAAGAPRFRHLPMQFYWFDDGLHVSATAPEQLHLLGARVLTIGGLPAAEALERLRPLLPIENESGFRLLAPSWLAVVELLQVLDIVEHKGAVELRVLLHESRQPVSVELPYLSWDDEIIWQRATLLMPATPLWLQNTAEHFHLEYLSDSKAVYLQINEFNETPQRRAAAVAARVLEMARSENAEKIVIDLRHNYGGDSSYSKPFVLALIRWERISQPGSFVVLTGRKTFSASIKFLNRLEQYTQMVTAGEAIGGTTNHFGDSSRMQLPNSGMTLRVSTVLWRDWTFLADRNTPPPYLPVELTAADYFGGKDPVLAAALEFDPPSELGDHLISAYESGGINAALLVYAGITDDPRTWNTHTEDATNALARHLQAQGKLAYAQGVFGYTLRRYPDSIPARLGLARVLVAAENYTEAKTVLQELVQFDPGHADARALLDELDGTAD